ncbi:MAG: MOSC domain-containing protein [bacterium]|nr:MOSC domain-containing protein [bacterium]
MIESRIVSIQVGMPATHGADAVSSKPWQSGIFKVPAQGRVFLDTHNLAGDGQQDLKNHGGPYRAVLAYSAAHYPLWEAELRPLLSEGVAFGYGAFGENFTVTGYDEDTIHIGDIIAVGEARLQVSQPRMPCWKLARRWGLKDLTARVDEKAWGGWYHRVIETGHVQAGDEYRVIDRLYPDLPIKRLYQLMVERETDTAAYHKLAGMFDILTPSWRTHYGHLAATHSSPA